MTDGAPAAHEPAPPAPAPVARPAPAVPTAAPPASAARPGPAPPGPGTGTAATPLGNAATTRTALARPANSVSLAAETLQLPEPMEIQLQDKPRPVPVHLGGYAQGVLTIVRRTDGLHTDPSPQQIPLIHPALDRLRAVGVDPMLEVSVQASRISGRATIGKSRDKDALATVIHEHGDKLGWVGVNLKRWATVENGLEAGQLKFMIHDLRFDLGALLAGSLTFGLQGDALVFDGAAALNLHGQRAALQVARDAQGGLAITGTMKLSIGKANADIHAHLDSTGKFDVRGTGAYQADKFSGEITVVVAEEKVADSLAKAQLGVESADQQAVDGGPVAGAATAKPPPAHPVVVGWGTLNFAISDWLTGTAKVVIGSRGHLTVIGDITPPAEVVLFEQRDYIRPLFKIEGRATYGIPAVGNVFVFAGIGMEALAKLGPGKLHSITLSGTYSTDPAVARAFRVSGTLTIAAFAGLQLRADGGAGLQIVEHDIKVGVGVNGLAGVKGYVEAIPTIGMREVGDPAVRKSEFYVKGHLEIGAQPFLGLSGDLFVNLDSPWWSAVPDKKWTWPLGALEYPLLGEFGIAADMEYVLGSKQLPDIKFGEVNFDSSKFITDLMNDHVPPKRKGEQGKPGAWKEGELGAAPPGKGATVSQGGGAVAGVPAARPGGPGGKDQSGKPAPKTGAPGARTGGRSGGPGHQSVPSPDVQKRWNEGIKELAQLAAHSKSNPLNDDDVKHVLAELKRRYGFTRLDARPIGDDWEVDAEMNPKKKTRVSGRRERMRRRERKLFGEYGWLFYVGEPGWRAALRRAPTYFVAYETKIPKSLYPGRSRADHFQAANQQLVRSMARDAQFAQIMEGLIPGIRKNLVGPRGGISRGSPSDLWTWHHHLRPGVLQLIPRIQHEAAGRMQQLLHPKGGGGVEEWG